MSHSTITGADVESVAFQSDSFGQAVNDRWVAEYADTARAAALDAIGGTEAPSGYRLALPADYAEHGWTCFADAVDAVYAALDGGDSEAMDYAGTTDDTEREVTDVLESLGYTLDWDSGPMIYDAVRAGTPGARHASSETAERDAEYWRAYGAPISDASARAIAAQWQSPGTVGSDLAALASGSRVNRRDAVADVDATLADLETDGVTLDTETPSARGGWTATDYVALHALRAWIVAAPSASGTLAD